MNSKSIFILFLCFFSMASLWAASAPEKTPVSSFRDRCWSIFKNSLAAGVGGMLGGGAVYDYGQEGRASLVQNACRLGSVAVCCTYAVSLLKIKPILANEKKLEKAKAELQEFELELKNEGWRMDQLLVRKARALCVSGRAHIESIGRYYDDLESDLFGFYRGEVAKFELPQSSSSRAWRMAHDFSSTVAYGVLVGAGSVKIASRENQPSSSNCSKIQ